MFFTVPWGSCECWCIPWKRTTHSFFFLNVRRKKTVHWTFVTTRIHSACMDHSEMIGYEKARLTQYVRILATYPQKNLRNLQNSYIFFKLTSVKHGISFIKKHFLSGSNIRHNISQKLFNLTCSLCNTCKQSCFLLLQNKDIVWNLYLSWLPWWLMTGGCFSLW